MHTIILNTNNESHALSNGGRGATAFKPLGLVFFLSAYLLTGACPALAVPSDLDGLAECVVNVFQEIAKTHAWSGRTKGCTTGRVVVGKRASGAFVTTWKLVESDGNWEKLALSAALGYRELADKKILEKAIRDVKSRTRRIEKCLNSIEERNDPGECRDTAQKVYSVGDVSGVDMERSVWLNDDGRHVVLSLSYGNSAASDTAPADLEQGPGLPPGMHIDLNLWLNDN